MWKTEPPPPETFEIEERELKKINRRRLLAWFALLGVGSPFLYKLIAGAEDERGLPWPLRSALAAEDGFWKANFSSRPQAVERAPVRGDARLNGDVGIDPNLNVGNWRLTVSDPATEKQFTLDDLKKLPKVTETFDFKCIEGWSQTMTFTGARFSDFMRTLGVGNRNSGDNADLDPYGYAGLTSVDGGYYVSMDSKSLMHPQTLLCYEMNGAPLTPEHGQPLRLVSAVKYGVKSIKQIGAIAFSDSPPADFWAENGYDDYLGL